MNAVPGDWAALGAKNAYLDTARQLEASGVSAADLKVEVETLSEFKKKVDAMLQSLDDSDASTPKISQQSLDQDHVGAFPDATNLLGAYDVVHQNLQTLSTTLSDQIQAMSIALNINMNGYQNVEDSQRQALWKIYNQTDEQYNSGVSPTGIVKPLNPDAPSTATSTDSSPATPASSSNSTQPTTALS
ncbi:hypothetical protein E6W39_17595 [Kitasatospora acidiphila]|uniref:Uncharacterized protein n=1 Tax=Kitasatospora acidiphila TaxID=2567942 RepID=A0A540W5T6_9ACTN|nr:hypothetical protein [Kitasatospora acidiphila]TQF03714.1 hypothetical protein E6W39_17595 [Kitasatospora acidiphila]